MKKIAVLNRILNAVGQMVTVSILWTVCSLPLFTIGAASSSLYYCTVKAVRRESGNVLTDFFRVFKENFWQALPVTMIILIYETLIGFLVVQHFHSTGIVGIDSFIAICVGFAIPGIWFMVYVFPCISRFYFKGIRLFRFVLYISVKHLASTLLIIGLFLVSGFLCLSNGVFLIIVPALYNFMVSFLLEPIFRDCSSNPDSYEYKLWYSDDRENL